MLGSAFVPRRVPKFKLDQQTGEYKFDGFWLTHYSMLLGSTDAEDVKNNEFVADLPHDRLDCFNIEKFFIAYDPKGLKKLSSYIEFINGYDKVFRIRHETFLRKNMDVFQTKKFDRLRHYVAGIQCTFNFDFVEVHQRVSYFGEKLLYRKNEQSGFWEFDQSLVTDDIFKQLVHADMPNWFVIGAKEHFKSEALVLCRNFAQRHNMGMYVSARQNIEELEKRNT